MRPRVLPAIAAWAVLALAAGAPVHAQALRVGVQEPPGVLDPMRAVTFSARHVLASLCERLLDVDPQLRVVPGAAQSWAWSGDGLALTLSLPAGRRFHDGSPLDAAAAKANLDRVRAAPDGAATGRLDGVAEVAAPDPATVVLRLERPDASLPARLAGPAGILVAPVRDPQDPFAPASLAPASPAQAASAQVSPAQVSPAQASSAPASSAQASLAQARFAQDANGAPVCSGPYRPAGSLPGGGVALERDDAHPDAAAYPLRQVLFLPQPDALQAIVALRRGELDVLERVAPASFPLLADDPGVRLQVDPGLGFQALAVNLRKRAGAGPLADRRVRQALDLALDRNLIAQAAGGALAPAGQPFPPASPAFEPRFQPAGRDIDAARALLREAGHERVAFELLHGDDPLMRQVFELVRGMGAQAGFDITLAPLPFPALQRRLAAGDFQAAQAGWAGRADPSGNIDPFLACRGALNDGGYCNPHLDRLLREARGQPDSAARKDLYDQAQAILQQDRPLIYLYYLPWPTALRTAVHGYQPHPDGLLRLRGVAVE